jgi:hypothetical protein
VLFIYAFVLLLLQRMADVLSSAALLGDAAGAQWRSCLSNLQRFVTDQLTGPFIQHLEVPGQAKPGLTFEVRVWFRVWSKDEPGCRV